MLPYRIGERTVLFGARSIGEGERRLLLTDLAGNPVKEPVRFVIEIAERCGPWEPVAELELGEQLPDDTADSLAFNPSNAGAALTPVGVGQAIRRLSYRASQAARPH